METTSFTDSVPTHINRATKQLLPELLTPADWATYSLDLNPMDLYLVPFAGESPGDISC
jgi:hypothetical protein